MFNDRLTLRSNSSMPTIFSFAHVIFSLKHIELLHSTVVHSITVQLLKQKMKIDHKFADCRHIKITNIYHSIMNKFSTLKHLLLQSYHYQLTFCRRTTVNRKKLESLYIHKSKKSDVTFLSVI